MDDSDFAAFIHTTRNARVGIQYSRKKVSTDIPHPLWSSTDCRDVDPILVLHLSQLKRVKQSSIMTFLVPDLTRPTAADIYYLSFIKGGNLV